MNKKPPEKMPPHERKKSLQLDLFGSFITNDKSGVSNTVEVWESIPKYFLTPSLVKKLRTATGHADPYKWEYIHNKQKCTVKIQPALIEQKDGSYKAFFPSVSEELTEEALKRIFTSQQYGFHDVENVESWVRFTLGMVHKELKGRGRTRSISQIKHSIEVMSSCIITLYHDKKEVWKGAILQDLVTVGREDYIADTSAHHIGRLPLFVSRSINRLEYRQFNFERLMQCDEQLSRWIYKRLINKYRNASIMNDYHFLYSDLKNSGLLQQSKENDNRRKVVSALNELKEKGVLSSFIIDERTEERKIVEVKYTVVGTLQFQKEQKAANARARENEMTALQSGIQLVDKP
jgi:hypothetical protein